MYLLSHSSFSTAILISGIAMFAAGAGILTHDTLQLHACRRAHAPHGSAGALASEETPAHAWRTSFALALLAWSPLVISAALLAALAG